MYCVRSLHSRMRIPFVLRGLSTEQNLVDMTVDGEGIAILSMKRPPVNSLNLEILQEINSKLDIVEKNKYKGLVLTSALHLFSAGLDFNELYNPDLKRLSLLCSTSQEMCLKLLGSEYTTGVAINGYTAAGGCALSLVCDYRVMANNEKAKIGLNDSVIGIVPRPFICDLFKRVMGVRQAEIALVSSTMYTAEEALKVNLIDETASNREDAIEKCKQFIRKHDGIELRVRGKIKRIIREAPIRWLQENREEDVRMMVDSIIDPQTQEKLKKLKKK